jgi:hypothetical protein
MHHYHYFEVVRQRYVEREWQTVETTLEDFKIPLFPLDPPLVDSLILKRIQPH